jgi:hypothetical protein
MRNNFAFAADTGVLSALRYREPAGIADARRSDDYDRCGERGAAASVSLIHGASPALHNTGQDS